MGQVRLLVNPAFVPLGEPEVLDRIRQVGVLPRQSGVIQRPVQQPPGRTDEGHALLVPGLLAAQHHLRFGRSGGERHLGRRLPQFAPSEIRRRDPQGCEVGILGNPPVGTRALRDPVVVAASFPGHPDRLARRRAGPAVATRRP